MARIDRGILCAIVLLPYFLTLGEGQIPYQCANQDSLPAGDNVDRKCCPTATIDGKQLECGGSERGKCTKLEDISSTDIMRARGERDPRIAWPAFYFTHVCKCKEKFGGVNCGSCAYGRYPHDKCDKMMVADRKNLKDYTSSEWEEYLNTIKATRSYDSGYKVFVDVSSFATSQGYASIRNQKRDINLYDFFVWNHYLVAKDSQTGKHS